jgi:hypothetical protein
MNFIEGKRAIIITNSNLDNMKYNRESSKCEFYDDLGMIVFKRDFGQHQMCFDYFSECNYLEYSNVAYLSKSIKNILIYIIGPIDKKYRLLFYIPSEIESIQLNGLKELIKSIDEEKIDVISARVFKEHDLEDFEFDLDFKNNFEQNIIKKYEEQRKR